MGTKITNRIKLSEEIDNSSANGLQKVTNGNSSANVLRETTTDTDELLKKMQKTRKEVLGYVDDHISNMISEVLQNTKTYPGKEREFTNNSNQYHDKRLSTKDGILPNKEFLARNSLLTDLFEIIHIRALYNVFMASLLLLFLNTAVYDIIDTGTLHIGTSTMQKAFDKFPTCCYIWLLMQISTLCVYLAFNLWGYQRLKFSPKCTFILKVWDYSWLIVLILYYNLFIIFPAKALFQENLPIGCSTIVLMEQVRFMMKSHAFVRSVAPMFLSYKPHTEVSKPNGPLFSQYLYFLFAPTLVYRDNYPRTKSIRWKVVARNFIEVISAIFYFAFVLERFVLSTFNIVGKDSSDWRWFVKSGIQMMLPGMLIFICAFYLLLHAWMNAWAELLRFADRLFYKDWWNSTSFRMYYRTWNVVVHDWLYTYVYKDMYEIVVPRNKVLATYAVFFMSSVFHEYILALTFRFFYPVLLILFGGIGFAVAFAKKGAHNVLMWLSFFIGMGFLVSMYTHECYARINCPPYHDKFLDFFIPRGWTC